MAARVPERESMALKDRVTAAMIRLDIGSERSLFIVFGADGTINRMGTGEEGSVEKRFFAGSTREPILARFLDGVREQALESPGSFVLPDPKGTPTTTVCSGTSLSTTAFAPMTAPSPTVTRPKTFAPAPIQTSLPITGELPRFDPIATSWCSRQFAPTLAFGFTTTEP